MMEAYEVAWNCFEGGINGEILTCVMAGVLDCGTLCSYVISKSFGAVFVLKQPKAVGLPKL
jgi:hypothetical protein